MQGENLVAQPLIHEYSLMVDDELKRVVSGRALPLYYMMEHHLGWGTADDPAPSPKLRPLGALCVASCGALGGDAAAALPLAASIELVQNFCDIHDDIQSGRVARDGRDTVWWKWGPAQAINAGDGMHALARLALLGLRDIGFESDAVFDAVRLLDEASLATCEGRFADLEAQERLDMTSDAYLSMAAAKTGSLWAGAMEFGALAAGADGQARKQLAEAGAKLGAALQIGQDTRHLLDALGGSAPPSEDFMNKKKMYPVVLAFEMASPSQRRRLGDYYFKRVLEPSDLRGLSAMVEETGALDRAERAAKSLMDDALGALRIGAGALGDTDEIENVIRQICKVG